MIILLFKLTITAYVFCALGSEGMIFSWYQRLLLKIPDWLAFPLGACHKCFTGQVCFWGYLFIFPYNFIDHLFFTSAGIFLSLIYDKLWTLLEQ